MKIYTKFGDAGQTQILGGIKLPKSDLRIKCIGEIDELNSALGFAMSLAHQHPFADSTLPARTAEVQHELFQWGAMLAGAKPERQSLPDKNSIQRLESEIDQWQASLPTMTHFILPGGTPCGASLHLARAVCRRCERCVTSLADESAPQTPTADASVESAGMNLLQTYLNRLSDWLFVAARTANQIAGIPETKWIARSD